MQVNIARTLPKSAANGPGERFVIWVQGCSLGCPGCWNPDTWSDAPGQLVDVGLLLSRIFGTPGIEGITLTGGEPFQQAESLLVLATKVRARGMSIVAFTGYRLSELVTPAQRALLRACDIVVAGRYLRNQRVEAERWRGSTNQIVHYLSGRYSASTQAETICEVHLGPDGEVRITGFPPDALLTLE
jgi:anaerobic ribonucleoside-triphosphate reductase activating protein